VALGSGWNDSTTTFEPPALTGTQFTTQFAAGDNTVEVFAEATPTGSNVTLSSPAFDYNAGVTITNISPPNGSPAGGATLTVTGSGFGPTDDSLSFSFCPDESTNVLAAGCALVSAENPWTDGPDGTATVTAPPLTSTQFQTQFEEGDDSVDVFASVYTPGEGAFIAESPAFDFEAPVRISKISPPSVSPAGGATLAVGGIGFGPPDDVLNFVFCPAGSTFAESNGCESQLASTWTDATATVKAPPLTTTQFQTQFAAENTTVEVFAQVFPPGGGTAIADSPAFGYNAGVTITSASSSGAGSSSGVTAAVGDQVTGTTSGNTPDGTVTATLHSTPVLLGSFTAGPDGVASFTVTIPTSTPPGAHELVLTDETTGLSATLPVTVTAPAATAPVFTADSPPLAATAGSPYAYTFQASGSPTPTYTLANGAPSWLSIDSTSGAVSGIPPEGATTFSYSLTAANGTAPDATAGPFTVTVAPATGTVTPNIELKSSAHEVKPGSVVTLTAHVSGHHHQPAPTGTVSFTDNASPIPSCTDLALPNTGKVTCKLAYANVEGSPHTIVASYSGDTTYAASSATATITVRPIKTHLRIRSTNNPGAPTEQITYQVVISADGDTHGLRGPTGTITFTDNGAVITSCDALPVGNWDAQCTITYPSAEGSPHHIVADYSGDGTYQAATANFTENIKPKHH